MAKRIREKSKSALRKRLGIPVEYEYEYEYEAVGHGTETKEYRTTMLLFREAPPLAGLVLALSLFFASAFCVFIFALADGNWNSFQPATCLTSPLGCFCERPRDTLLRQPINTVTNLAFTIVGALILVEGVHQWGFAKKEFAKSKVESKPRETFGEVFNVVSGIANVILGLGSLWYHASLTFVGQFIDNAGMYLVVVGPPLFALASVRAQKSGKPPNSVGFVIVYILVNVLASYAAYSYPETRRHLFLGLIILGIVCEAYARRVCGEVRRKQGQIKKLFASAVVMAIAFTIWNLDLRGYWCDPDSMLQG